MFAQRNSQYLIDAATLIAGLEGQEGSPESTCLDILWMLLESNQIEVLILTEEWESLRSHIHNKIKEPRKAEALLERIKKNIKPIQDDKDEKIKLLYFANIFKGNSQEIVSIEEVVTQHTAPQLNPYNGTNAAIESLVFLLSVWLTKEIFGVKLGEFETLIDDLGGFLNSGQQSRHLSQSTGTHQGDRDVSSLNFDRSPNQTFQPLEHGNSQPGHLAVLLNPVVINSAVSNQAPDLVLAQALSTLRQVLRVDGYQRILPVGPKTPARPDTPSTEVNQSADRSPQYSRGETAKEATAADEKIARDRVINTTAPEPFPAVNSPSLSGEKNFEIGLGFLGDVFIVTAKAIFMTSGNPAGVELVVGSPSAPGLSSPPASPSVIVTHPVPPSSQPIENSTAVQVLDYFYDAHGNLSRLSFDTDNNHIADWINFYSYSAEGDLESQFSDIQGDGIIDQIRLFADGKIVAFLADTNHDAIFDVSISRESIAPEILKNILDKFNSNTFENAKLSLEAIPQEYSSLASEYSYSAVGLETTPHLKDEAGLLSQIRDVLLQGGHLKEAPGENFAGKETGLDSIRLEGALDSRVSLLLAGQLSQLEIQDWLHSSLTHQELSPLNEGPLLTATAN